MVNERLEKAYKTKENISGKVKKIDKELNLIIDLGNGFEGIIHKEELNIEEGFDKILNKVLKFKIIDYVNNQYILSIKAAEQEKKQWIKNNIKVGSIIYGKVKSLQTYGVFVELAKGISGLIYLEDISVVRLRHPSERFNVGQKIKVKVKDINLSTGRILLSVKDLFGSWQNNADKFKEGTTVLGIVRQKEKNGVFVELTPNLVGLAEHKVGIEYGQKVNVYIKKIIPEKEKIKLLIVN